MSPQAQHKTSARGLCVWDSSGESLTLATRAQPAEHALALMLHQHPVYGLTLRYSGPDIAWPEQGKVRAFHLAMVADEFGERPATEWNRCKTGVIPSRAPYV